MGEDMRGEFVWCGRPLIKTPRHPLNLPHPHSSEKHSPARTSVLKAIPDTAITTTAHQQASCWTGHMREQGYKSDSQVVGSTQEMRYITSPRTSPQRVSPSLLPPLSPSLLRLSNNNNLHRIIHTLAPLAPPAPAVHPPPSQSCLHSEEGELG